jgi:hypothetical protein
MTWARTIDLYLNLDRTAGNVLMRSASDPTGAVPPVWVEGDTFTLRLHLLRPTGSGGLSRQTLASDDVILLGARVKRGRGVLLFSAGEFSEETVDGVEVYQAQVNLNTAELVDAFGLEQILQVAIDVEIQNAADTARLSVPFLVNVIRQARAGSEVDPPAVSAANHGFRFKADGAGGLLFQLKDKATGKYHTTFLNSGQLAKGPAED